MFLQFVFSLCVKYWLHTCHFLKVNLFDILQYWFQHIAQSSIAFLTYISSHGHCVTSYIFCSNFHRFHSKFLAQSSVITLQFQGMVTSMSTDFVLVQRILCLLSVIFLSYFQHISLILSPLLLLFFVCQLLFSILTTRCA